MKKWSLGLSLLAFFCLLLLPLAKVHADTSASAIRLVLEGESLKPEVPPKIVKGRTLVPIRIVAEGFGAEVGWEPNRKKITIVNESMNLSMEIGKQEAIVNGKEVAMDVPPSVDKGRTLVPLRFVGESLGTTVGWDADARSVIINQAYSLQAEGLDLAGKEAFKMNGEFYLPVEPIASLLGVAAQEAYEKHAEWKMKKLDGDWYIPQSSLTEKGKVKLDISGKQIQLEKESKNEAAKANQLMLVEEKDKGIVIYTSMPVVPKHFLMDNPARLVIDLPGTILSEQLMETEQFQNGMGIVKAKTVRPLSTDHLLTLPAENETSLTVDAESEAAALQADQAEIEASENEDEEDPIKAIRFSQFSLEPQTVRVVVELTRNMKYSLRESKEGLEVAFMPLPKKEGFLVVLDPGHGGTDPGAKGISGNKEKDLTLAVYRLLKEELKKYKGIQVMETRTDDTYPTLQERVQLANEANADLFLSIHANSFKPQTRGTETFYFTSQSEDLANVIHKHLLQATGFPDRGVKKSGFYVIKNTTMPSSLMEIGFLSNAEENDQMLKPEFQAKVAKAVGEAIYEYYTSYK